MARGWESKSIEEQQSLATAEGSEQPQRSAADVARASQRQAIELQIRRVEQQLLDSGSERHREMLQLALADLQKKFQSI